MTNENVNTGRGIYKIDQNIGVYPAQSLAILQYNKLLSDASGSAKLPSENIAHTPYQTLEERLKPELAGILQNRELEAAIEIFTTIALTTDVEYKDSGSLDNAFGKLVKKVRILRGYEYKNTELHNALGILVKEGYITQGRALTGYKGPILISTSKIDPYLNNTKPYVSKEKSNKHKKPNNHHSLRELGEKLHLVGHHK